jgi:hypothetical protein
MPNTQFSTITIDDNHNITATGPYNPGLVNTDGSRWQLVGKPVVVFMVVKDERASQDTTEDESAEDESAEDESAEDESAEDGNPGGGSPGGSLPDLVVDGVGYYNPGSGDWSGTIPFETGSAAAQMAANDVVRAVGAAIQVKTDLNDRKNPPVVEVITWCVPKTLSSPGASASGPTPT